MTRLAVIAALVAAAVGVTAAGAGAVGGKLKCFSGSPATCVVNSGTTSATLDTSNGGYAGIYYSNGKSLGGSALAGVDFSFDYRCQPSNVDTTTCVGGGAPRWSIPIDTGGDPKDTQQVYAFLDAANCGSTGTVSTTVSTCPVFVNTGGSYANWDEFAAAEPTYTIASALPFVISDVQTAPVIIYNPTATKS